MAIKLNAAGDARAASLVRMGDADTKSPWSFDASDGDLLLGAGRDDWARYRSAHLGEDPDAGLETRERYGYPFAKLVNGKLTLFRSALEAIRSRAGQQGASDILEAAGRLLADLDRNTGDDGKPTARASAGDDGPASIQAGPDAAMAGSGVAIEATASFLADSDVEALATSGDGPKLPRFEMVANSGYTPFRQPGWRYPLIVDFAGLAIPSQNRPIRLNHDPDQGVGHTTSVGFSGGQLVAEGVISRNTPAAADVAQSGKNGFPWQASIGASIDGAPEFVPEGKTVLVNGHTFSGPLNVVRKATLGEISFADLGADGNTSARVAAAAPPPAPAPSPVPPRPSDPSEVKKMNFEAWLQAKGFDPAALSDAQRTALKASYDHERRGSDLDPEDDTAQSIERARKERERRRGIKALADEYLGYKGANVEAIARIVAKAEDEDWTVKDTELALLRDSRPRAPQNRAHPDALAPKVLEAAFALCCGVNDNELAKDRRYGEDVVNAAYPHRNLGVHGLIRAAFEAAGLRAPHGRLELFDALLEQSRIQASGFSTINLPGILGNVANKVLLQAFTLVDATYDRIAEQADFANFQTHTMYRLDHLGEFAVVGNDGQLQHGNLGQTYFTNKLDTSGQILTFTRQDIINDDLNAFRSLTAQLARKARIAVEKALYSKICESADSFYTTGQGNKLTGSLDIVSLGAAEGALLGMADAYGDPIYAQPRYLVVPPPLKFLADDIYTSAEIRTTRSSVTQPTGNPFRGRFEVVSSPYLNSSVISGSSATTWYLLADPMILPAFQVAYLNGNRQPTIQTQDASFNVLGYQMRVFFDYGVAQLDYRGAIKNV